MLFNCTKCCKAISSALDTCPYCRMETSGMMEAVTSLPIREKAEHTRKLLSFFVKRSAYRAKKGAEHFSEKLPSIAEVLGKIRAQVSREKVR